MEEDKITTARLSKSTSRKFNIAKIENKFNSADDFLNFLLDFYEKYSDLSEEIEKIKNQNVEDNYNKEDIKKLNSLCEAN